MITEDVKSVREDDPSKVTKVVEVIDVLLLFTLFDLKSWPKEPTQR